MRIGLIGLGRIGAFHAETLSKLSSVTSLVVTDAVPAAIRSVVERFGVEAAATPEELLASGVDGVVVAAATDAHPELILAAAEAGVPVFCEKPVARTMAEGLAVARRVAGQGVPSPDRLSTADSTPGFAAVRAGDRERRARVGAHRALHDLGPGAAAAPPTSLCPAASSATAVCTTSTPSAGSPAARSSRSTQRGRTGGTPSSPRPATWHFAASVLTLDDGTRAVVSNSRYNARGHDVRMEVHGSADSIAAGLDDRLPLRSAQPGVTFPAASRTCSSWTASRTPSGRSWRRLPRWSPGPDPRRARSKTRWRRAGWPRPPRCRWPSTVQSASTRCASRCPEDQSNRRWLG